MRVKMLIQVSGSRDGVDWPAPGQEIDLPDGEAAALCKAQMAEAVAVPEEKATTTVAGPDNTRAAAPAAPAAPAKAEATGA